MKPTAWSAAAATLAAFAAVSCAGPNGPTPGPPPPGASNVLVGAGDIAVCGSSATQATASLLDNIEGTVSTAGDNVYDNGTFDEFMRCYEPTWGRHKSRTRPSPGNHDYAHGPSGYFAYFGASAGPPGLGYYSFRVGSWHVLSMNSNVAAHVGSPQFAWMLQELTDNSARCTAAIWHHPVFSSGPNGPQGEMRDVWRAMVLADVDVVIVGHDHLYERFAPLDAEGLPSARGIQQFTVGTGGASLYQFQRIAPGSEARASVHGVLKLTLNEGSYDWEFVAVPGVPFTDRGRGDCH